jgi:hypothetical protein
MRATFMPAELLIQYLRKQASAAAAAAAGASAKINAVH